jgi:oligoendopeptidase F
MKFENMKYERPNIQEIEKTFKEMIDEFKNSKSAKEQLEIINKLNDYSRDFSTMFSLANIRYSINTNDEFYKKEIEFINENEPILDGLENEFKKLVFNSKFKKELK